MSDVPIGAYTFSDSYLRKLKKDDLIEYYRTLEKNWFNEIKLSNIQIDNSKKLLKEEYNKAIDDFREELLKVDNSAIPQYCQAEFCEGNCKKCTSEIYKIAEQLKGMKQNED